MKTFSIWHYLLLLRFCSVQLVGTLLVLICTDNFSVNFLGGCWMMSKYLRCNKIYKEMILEIAKQKLIMKTMSIVWILDVKKVANELSGPFAPQADNDSSNHPGDFHKTLFFAERFDWNWLTIYRKLFIRPFFIVPMHTGRQNI